MDADIEADLSSLLEEFERLSVPLPSAEQKLDAVASLVKIHRELDSFDQYLRSGELVGASVSLGEMVRTCLSCSLSWLVQTYSIESC